jgi:hypothetical protein
MSPYEKAQRGIALIEEAILEILSETSAKTNAEVTQRLGLESDQDGKQKDYLAYSVLGRMMKSGRVRKVPGQGTRHSGYVKAPDS